MPDSFTDAAAGATAALEGLEATPIPETSVDPQAAPVPEAAVPPAQLTIPDDYKVTVQVAGQPVEMTFKELRESGMRHADYSRKTQEVSAARKELEDARTEIQRTYAEHAQMLNFLRDPTKILTYAAQLQTQSQAQVAQTPGANPDEVISRAEALQLAQQQIAEAEKNLEQRFNERLLSFNLERDVEVSKAEINKTIQAQLQRHPELKAIKQVERVLKAEVAARNPQNLDEARTFMAEAVKGQLDELENLWTSRAKSQAVTAAKLQNRIEPPGGAPVQPSSRKFSLKEGSQGHKDLLKAAEEALIASNR